MSGVRTFLLSMVLIFPFWVCPCSAQDELPTFRVDTSLLYFQGLVKIDWDLEGLVLPSTTDSALAEVYSTKDDVLAASFPLNVSDKERTGTYSLNISTLPPGNYVLKVYLRNEGKTISQANSQFIIPERPVWLGNTLGISDKVPPPFTPVTISGNSVSVWGREYQFTGLPFPSQIVNQGKPMLSSAIRLDVVTGQGTIPWEGGKLDCLSKTDNAVKLRLTNTSPQIEMVGDVTVEFDGFVRVDITLFPKGPAVIQKIVLQIPVKDEDALYIKGMRILPNDWNTYSAPLYEGARGGNFSYGVAGQHYFFSDKGWVWPDDFMHSVWIGGDKTGLSVTFDSDQNFQSKKYVEVVNTKGTKELTFNLIDSPYTLSEPLSYTLVLQATPVKPLPSDPKKWHVGTTDATKDFYAVELNEISPGFGVPELTPPGKYLVKKAWETEGCRITPYYVTRVISTQSPEFQLFGKEWEGIPLCQQDWGSKDNPAPITIVCPQSESFRDYFIWGINKLIDEGVKGIYIDYMGTNPCTSPDHKCGYIDKEGKRKPILNLFTAREQYKRMYTLFKERDPDSCVFMHTASITPGPLFSFFDVATEGEEFGEPWAAQEKFGYANLTPDFFRAGYAMNQQYGVPFLFFAYLSYGWRFPPSEIAPVPPEETVTYTLIHNIYPLPSVLGTSNKLGLIHLKPIWDILDEWYTTSEWIPYWKNSELVSSFGKDIKVSIYRKDKKKSLLLVANLGASTAAGEIKLRLPGFGLDQANARLTKIDPAVIEYKGGEPRVGAKEHVIKPMTKQEIPLMDSAAQVSLPGKSLQFFLLEEE